MTRTGAVPREGHDRVSFLKRLNEDELMVYVDRVLEQRRSIDPRTLGTVSDETNCSASIARLAEPSR